MVNNLERGLIIKKDWLDLIFNEHDPKTWEMRSRSTNIRGRVGLIESGSGMIVGETIIVDSLEPKDVREWEYWKEFHKVDDLDLLEKWCWAWVFENTIKYNKPIPYNHPKGAVVWVKF